MATDQKVGGSNHSGRIKDRCFGSSLRLDRSSELPGKLPDGSAALARVGNRPIWGLCDDPGYGDEVLPETHALRNIGGGEIVVITTELL